MGGGNFSSDAASHSLSAISACRCFTIKCSERNVIPSESNDTMILDVRAVSGNRAIEKRNA
jgi:hypothetical protein